MKQSTKRILEHFPFLEEHLKTNESALLTDEVLSKLNNVEQIFLRLAWFFENPETENFNLESIYKNLDNNWIELSLEVIRLFFVKDTYLIQKPTHAVITDGDYYMNQSKFANFLTENGLNYDRAKINMYIKRGIIPDPDITVSGTKYWERSTCEKFLKKQVNNSLS